MANANDDIFRSDLFKTLIAGFWDQFYWVMFFMGLLPFVLYFLATLTFFSYHLKDDWDEISGFTLVEDHILVYMIVGFASYTLITEIVAIIEQGLAYFGNVTNIFDTISIIINLSITTNHYWQLEFYSQEF